MYNIWKSNEIDNYKGDNLNLFRFLYLNIKTVYSTWATRIVIILSPLLVTLALSVMMPLHYYIGAGQIFVTTLSAGTIWGMTYFSFRKSTIYENIRGTKSKNHEMYLSIFITILMVTFCSEVIFWLSSILFSYMIPSSIFERLLNSVSSDYSYSWGNIDWITQIYTWFMQVSLMFAGSFVLRGIFNNEKNYFIILFILILILFPFGGLLRPGLEYVSDNGIQIKNINAIKYISLVFPQTCLNYMSFAAISSGSLLNNVSLGGLDVLSSWDISTQWQWNFVIFYPILVFTILSVISLLTVDFIK